VDLPFGRWVRAEEKLAEVTSVFGVSWFELRAVPFTEHVKVETGDSDSQILSIPVNPFANVLDCLRSVVSAAQKVDLSITTETHALFLQSIAPRGADLPGAELSPPPIREVTGMWINHIHEGPRAPDESLLCDYPLPLREANHALSGLVEETNTLSLAEDFVLMLRRRNSQKVALYFVEDDPYGQSATKTRSEVVLVDPFWTVVYAKRVFLKTFGLIDSGDAAKENDFKLLLAPAHRMSVYTHPVWLKERTLVNGADGTQHKEPLHLVDYFTQFELLGSGGVFGIHIRTKLRSLLVEMPDARTHSVQVYESDTVATGSLSTTAFVCVCSSFLGLTFGLTLCLCSIDETLARCGTRA
jgi:hypothetical protein